MCAVLSFVNCGLIMSINMLGLLSSKILEELSHELSRVLSETLGRSQRQSSFQTEKLICRVQILASGFSVLGRAKRACPFCLTIHVTFHESMLDLFTFGFLTWLKAFRKYTIFAGNEVILSSSPKWYSL